MSELRQIAVVSGKGGTGKTTVTASLASLLASRGFELALVDADVDAPNLHVLFHGGEIEREVMKGPPLARLNAVKPETHGSWQDVCVFDAIQGLEVDPLRCIGCRVCEISASPCGVRMEERKAGEIITEELPFGPFLHGRLYPGEAGFGAFCYRLRARAEEITLERGINLILIDGSPGIGCPVIASIIGCDMVLIVAEPTVSGWHDFLRICQLCSGLGLRVAVCINKHDINHSISSQIEQLCREKNLLFAGKIPFDDCVISALNTGKILTEVYPDSAALQGVKLVAQKIEIIQGVVRDG